MSDTRPIPSQPTFSVIVPTSGRRTLLRTLSSIVPQLRDGDELLVLHSDGGDLGHGARNSAMSRAKGSHLLFMDDDDVFTNGALATMRAFAAEHPDRIGIFRMRFGLHPHYRYGDVLWKTPELKWGNVGTPMFVIPNVTGKLGRWVARRAGDWDFIEETVGLQGDPMFCDEIVASLRPVGRLLVPWAVARPWLRAVDRGLGGPVARLRRGGRGSPS